MDCGVATNYDILRVSCKSDENRIFECFKNLHVFVGKIWGSVACICLVDFKDLKLKASLFFPLMNELLYQHTPQQGSVLSS